VFEPGDDQALHQHPSESKGRPGSRAPHVFLTRDGEEVSTLDLFGRHYVLLAAADGAGWRDAARAAAAGLGVALDAYVVGDELTDPGGSFAGAHGISAGGAVVVRPDGIVGWRSADAAGVSEATMHGVLASLLCIQ
jgi:hypothetical protein